jgi:hypothetical protein
MPTQQRVGRRNRGDLVQGTPTDADGAESEPTPVAVRQSHPSRPELSAQEPVFDEKVAEDFTFAVLKPR